MTTSSKRGGAHTHAKKKRICKQEKSVKQDSVKQMLKDVEMTVPKSRETIYAATQGMRACNSNECTKVQKINSFCPLST